MNLRAAHGAAYAEVERIATEGGPAFSERFRTLLRSTGDRELKLWVAADAPIEMTFEYLASINAHEIGPDWQRAIESIIAAARIQALVDTGLIIEMMTASSERARRIHEIVKAMSREEIHAVATDGTGENDGTSA